MWLGIKWYTLLQMRQQQIISNRFNQICCLIKLQCIVQLTRTMMIKLLRKSLDITKAISFASSLIWLVLVVRYLDIRPDYAHRNYLKNYQQIPKNNGIVHMSQITSLTADKTVNSISKDDQPIFKYFNFLYLSQSNKLNCKSHLQVLFINGNYKQTGDNYLSVYKQIQKYNENCRSTIYQLSRKDHLLMNSQELISDYAKEVVKAIQYLNNDTEITKLMIVSFQESSVITIKVLQLLQIQIIQKLNGFVFINAINPNLRVLYESPFRYIKSVQNNLLRDPNKLKTLNSTKLIFISTLKYLDPYPQNKEEQFNFLFGDRKLKNTLFLTTRFMRNLYVLMHEKDYFAFSYFSTLFAKFLIQDSHRTMNIRLIEYYFYYGQVYSSPNYQLDIKNCVARNPPTTKTNIVKQKNSCVIFNFACNCRNRNDQFAITVARGGSVYNDKLQMLQPLFEFKNFTYYLIEQTAKTKSIIVMNPSKEQISYTTPPIYAPLSNPLSVSSLSFLALTFANTQRAIDHKLIKICPTGNIIAYPYHFLHYLVGQSHYHAIFLHTLKVMIDHYQISSSQTIDCYPDFTTQFNLAPSQIFLQWQFTRNSLLLLLLCSYIRKDGIYAGFYFYLVLSFLTIWYYLHQQQYTFTYFIICSAICIQKFIKIIIHLTGFVQQILDIKYRKFMLTITLFLAILKAIGSNIEQFAHLSAWKVLCISLIFVVNKHNMLILLIKLNFLYDHIIYNHSDIIQIALVLMWIYVGLNQEQTQKNTSNKSEQSNKSKQYKLELASIFLISGFLMFMNEPTNLLNNLFNSYIVVRFMQTVYKTKITKINWRKLK